jgi:hypothetical protein
MPVRPTGRLNASRIAAERLRIKVSASVARFSQDVEKRDARWPNNTFMADPLFRKRTQLGVEGYLVLLLNFRDSTVRFVRLSCGHDSPLELSVNLTVVPVGDFNQPILQLTGAIENRISKGRY